MISAAQEFWGRRRVCVTGGAGFLGSFLTARLRQRGCPEIFVPRSRDFDLRDPQAVVRLYDVFRPDIVIHLAAVVGGIGANRANPGRFFYDNLMMGAHLIHQAMQRRIEKFICLGTICAYPKFTPIPFREGDLWSGFPEETNAPYGIAKKALLVQAQAYRQQYGLNAVYLLPVNLYGPGDNFDPESSHVIPAIIKKCVDSSLAGERRIVLWGTGSPTREFLHADDCAEGILLASERYNKPDPVNLGTGLEISIRDLAELIARLAGFHGEMVWDASYPDGQPRRCLDITRAQAEFGFRAGITLEQGIRQTIDWYLQQRKTSAAVQLGSGT